MTEELSDQRKRDIERSSRRGLAFKSVHGVADTLDGYMQARKNSGTSTTSVIWWRVAIASALVLALLGAISWGAVEHPLVSGCAFGTCVLALLIQRARKRSWRRSWTKR